MRPRPDKSVGRASLRVDIGKHGRLRTAAFFMLALFVAGLERGSDAAAERNAWTSPGTLRVALASLPNTLDPIVRTQVIEGFTDRFIDDPLIAQAIDGRLDPVLTREVPNTANGGISADGRTITDRLRRGVRWHDGHPFTSADVRFTFEAVMDAHNPVASRVGYEDVRNARYPRCLHGRRAPQAPERAVIINTTHPPLDDVRVRRASALAIDRETIAAKLYQGLATPADADLPAFMGMRARGFVGQHFDLADAGRALDAAGGRAGRMEPAYGLANRSN